MTPDRSSCSRCRNQTRSCSRIPSAKVDALHAGPMDEALLGREPVPCPLTARASSVPYTSQTGTRISATSKPRGLMKARPSKTPPSGRVRRKGEDPALPRLGV